MLAVQGSSGHSFQFWSAARHDREMRDRAMMYLQQVGLDARAQQIAANVSHGEQRQLEVAMALAMQPRLLLLDAMAGMGKERCAHDQILSALKGDKTMLLVSRYGCGFLAG